MATRNLDNVIVARSGSVKFALKSPTLELPTSLDSVLSEDWNNVGLLNSPGITWGNSNNTSTSNFWQDNEEFEISNGGSMTFGFELNQWDLDTIPLFFNTTVSDSGTFDVDTNAPSEVALYIQIVNGTKEKGILVPDFRITERGDINFISTDKLALPVTGKGYRSPLIGNKVARVFDPSLATV